MNLGVIVGRFQVPELHEAHLKLIRHVQSQFDIVLIVLGVSPIPSSPRNPLDFMTREKMIHESFPEIAVLALKDCVSDEEWSTNLDQLIHDVNPSGGRVVLFGGRESFIPFYKGKLKISEIEQEHFWTGTQLREQASNQIVSSKDFRHGIIFGLTNQFPRIFLTVDIAVMQGPSILMGKKAHESFLRFPGGFVDQGDESLEQAVQREVREELGILPTSLAPPDMFYVGSLRVNDWRYPHRIDGVVMTNLFLIKSFEAIEEEPLAGDDLDKIEWIEFTEDNEELIMPSHKPLWQMLFANHQQLDFKPKKLVGWKETERVQGGKR